MFRKLNKRIEDLEIIVWGLQRPPKFKIQDNVIISSPILYFVSVGVVIDSRIKCYKDSYRRDYEVFCDSRKIWVSEYSLTKKKKK